MFNIFGATQYTYGQYDNFIYRALSYNFSNIVNHIKSLNDLTNSYKNVRKTTIVIAIGIVLQGVASISKLHLAAIAI